MCVDLTTYYEPTTRTCVPCPLKEGHEVNPNCGHDDVGDQQLSWFKKCAVGTFNEGSRAHCEPCSSCPPGFIISSACNITTDTQCEEKRSPVTEPPVSTLDDVTLPCAPKSYVGAGAAAALFLTLALLCVVVIYVKRRRGQQAAVMTFRRRSSLANDRFTQLEDVLSPDVLSLPLQAVLDDLDVLEELVMLLDPDSQEAKSTKHLASHCSFPSTWITYIYSMKDSKSPLKAVLESVASRHPDWTVGHLAKLLRQMERNDAVGVLAKLRQGGWVIY